MNYKRLNQFILILIFSASLLSAQEADSENGAVGAERIVPSNSAVPVFPDENPNIVFLEGEAAVSTNFNKEATLNYSASGSRTLQLNRTTGLQGGASFYAEYVFIVPEDGVYEFWYGGTPPGPADDLYPSYSSPFSYSIDNGSAVSIFREDVVVSSGYTPSYYWSSVDDLDLLKGSHTIKIYVNQRRRYDNRYYFYIDNLFFVNKSNKDQIGDNVPAVFPKDLNTDILDSPFLSVSDYAYIIQENPERKNPYIELSLVYSLVGDYISALKNLKQAVLLDPEDPYPQLLTAKNRIWKGDTDVGLQMYRQILTENPEQLAVWAEAGKVAAWTGKYSESIGFFSDGLLHFDGELGLHVNMGLTYLWRSDNGNAGIQFAKAEELALESPEKMKELGQIYVVNGYSEKAVDVYLKAVDDYPEYLEFYLLLQEIYTNLDEAESAEKIESLIRKVFVPSEKLDLYLEAFDLKLGKRQLVINNYRNQLAARPDDKILREVLVQTLFWNGYREEAIKEYLNILITYNYESITQFDSSASDVLEMIDNSHLYSGFFQKNRLSAAEYRKRLGTALKEYASWKKKSSVYSAKIDAAREKGLSIPPVPGEGDPGDILLDKETELLLLLGEAEEFLSFLEININSFLSFTDASEQMNEKETLDNEAFKKLTDPLGWSFDRSEYVSELIKISQSSKNPLADYILAKIFMFEGRPGLAKPYVEKLQAGSLEYDSFSYLYGQISLWDGQEVTDSGYLDAESYISYIDNFTSLKEQLEWLSLDSGGMSSLDPAAVVPEIINSLSAAEKNLSVSLRDSQKARLSLSRILHNKLLRSIYSFQVNTVLLRYELGDYYLTDMELEKATEQFQYVLAVDPWNLSATYKLGTVRQLYGDWSGAMDKYKKVYSTDPFFGNASKYYNDLAKAHPDTLLTSGYILTDNKRMIYHGETMFSTNVDSVFSLNLGYTFDGVRQLLDIDSSAEAGTYMLHDIRVELPFNLYPVNLTLTPLGGLYLRSFLDFNIALAGDVVPANYNGSLSDFFSNLRASPYGGVRVEFEVPYFSLTGEYKYHKMEETFAPKKPTVMSHTGELTLFASLAGAGVPFFSLTDFRTYGRVKFLDDNNFMWMVTQDINLGIHILDNPWSTLIIKANVSYEDSMDIFTTDYWVPNSVFTVKGGLLWSSWFALGDGDALGLIIRAAAGVYIEALDSLPVNMLLVDGDFRLEYSKGSTSYYLSATGNSTFNSVNEAVYWSVLVQLGVNARLPKLLTQ